MRTPTTRLSARLKSFVLLLVISFAIAPFSSMLLMARHGTGATAAAAHDAKPPCPMHGAAAEASMAGSYSDHVGGNDAAAADQGCYCGLFCHAAIAGISGPEAMPDGLRLLVAPAKPSLLHGLWPKPLPRPPQA